MLLLEFSLEIHQPGLESKYIGNSFPKRTSCIWPEELIHFYQPTDGYQQGAIRTVDVIMCLCWDSRGVIDTQNLLRLPSQHRYIRMVLNQDCKTTITRISSNPFKSGDGPIVSTEVCQYCLVEIPHCSGGTGSPMMWCVWRWDWHQWKSFSSICSQHLKRAWWCFCRSFNTDKNRIRPKHRIQH